MTAPGWSCRSYSPQPKKKPARLTDAAPAQRSRAARAAAARRRVVDMEVLSLGGPGREVDGGRAGARPSQNDTRCSVRKRAAAREKRRKAPRGVRDEKAARPARVAPAPMTGHA